ncbi:amidohydrolase family protein [Pseudonocardia sp. TRM90224]|uniref:amidohydrolase family protein n=1 Tax=Pseudonocardia sp. TRM90224 TaxID=2812678 RepID=UPI001E60088F|nr:amidohydrolase family protein [Pseudonocardia sp. TRM90224]
MIGGAVDVHAHVLEAPPTPFENVAYQPFAAPVADYLTHLDDLGFARGVLVNPSAYHGDHTVLLAALRAHPDRLRGVAVLPSTVDDTVLDELHDAGVRGIRVQDRMRGGLAIDELPRWLPRLAERGWHAEVWTDLEEHLPAVRAAVESGVAPVLLDHLGNLPPGGSGTATLLELLRAGPSWVCLSGAYRLSPGAAEADAAAPLVDRVATIIETAPDRIVWGSDWPYVAPPGPRPTLADHESVLARWLPEPDVRERVLATNPALLYGWT